MAKYVGFRVKSTKKTKEDSSFIYFDPRVIVLFGETGGSVFVETVGGNCYVVLESLEAVKEKLLCE